MMERIRGTRNRTPVQQPHKNTAPLTVMLKELFGANKHDPLFNRILKCFTLKDDQFVSKQYNGKGPLISAGRRFCYSGLRNSALIIGDHTDISYYTIDEAIIMGNSQPILRMQNLEYLEKYLLIPTSSGKLIFVSDLHTHALFGWALAKFLKIIDCNSMLIHIDEHFDNEYFVPSNNCLPFTEDLNTVAAFCKKHLDITDFLSMGKANQNTKSGFFNDIYFVLTDQSGLGTTGIPIQNAHRRIGGVKVSIEVISSELDDLKNSDRKIIADIDLDYFAAYYNNPHKNNGTKFSRSMISQQMSFNDNFDHVVEIAKKADFVTVATSPDFFRNHKESNLLLKLLQAI